MKSITKILTLIGLVGLLVSSASAQTCYSNFNGQNAYYDTAATYPINVNFDPTKPFTNSGKFQVGNNIKAGGITMHWRYSTDAVTVQRPINTLPGYSKFTKLGEGTNTGSVKFYMTKFTKAATYYISFKYQSQRGDLLTSIYKITAK